VTSITDSIDRFKTNEQRLNDFVNDNAAHFYIAAGGAHVETMPSLVTRMAAAIAAASATATSLASASGNGGAAAIGYNGTTVAATLTAYNTAIQARLSLEGGAMTGPLTLKADPTTALGAATKQYVDAQANLARLHAVALSF